MFACKPAFSQSLERSKRTVSICERVLHRLLLRSTAALDLQALLHQSARAEDPGHAAIAARRLSQLVVRPDFLAQLVVTVARTQRDAGTDAGHTAPSLTHLLCQVAHLARVAETARAEGGDVHAGHACVFPSLALFDNLST